MQNENDTSFCSTFSGDAVGTFIKHAPCPKCGSSDALAVYTDNVHCFSCQHHEQGDFTDLEDAPKMSTLPLSGNNAVKKPIVYQNIPERGIGSATTKFYGVEVDEIGRAHV